MQEYRVLSEAQKILDERLAKGEIDDLEYDKLVAKINQQSDQPADVSSSPKVRSIEIEGGVINLDGYDGVRTKVELLSQAVAIVGLLCAGVGLYQSNVNTILAGGFLVVFVGVLIFYTQCTIVQISKNGTWQDIGKYPYSKAEEIKSQLIAAL